MAMAAWNYQTIAGREFAATHADVRKLFEQMSFPRTNMGAHVSRGIENARRNASTIGENGERESGQRRFRGRCRSPF